MFKCVKILRVTKYAFMTIPVQCLVNFRFEDLTEQLHQYLSY